jgi:hypothetical protein
VLHGLGGVTGLAAVAWGGDWLRRLSTFPDFIVASCALLLFSGAALLTCYLAEG